MAIAGRRILGALVLILIPICQSALALLGPGWTEIETDTGGKLEYKVVGSINPNPRYPMPRVEVYQEDPEEDAILAKRHIFNPDRMTQMVFDCHGHVTVYSGEHLEYHEFQVVTPRSVAGEIERNACAYGAASDEHANTKPAPKQKTASVAPAPKQKTALTDSEYADFWYNQLKFKWNKADETVGISGLATENPGDIPNCEMGKLYYGKIIKRFFDAEGINLANLVIERKDGRRESLYVDVPNDLGEVPAKDIRDALQRVSKPGRTAHVRAAYCGSGGIAELDQIE